MSPDIWARIATRLCDRINDASPAGEIPNRFLAWGTFALPYRIRISPHVPQTRYPQYFSLNARVSKDLNLGSKHAIRLSLSGINLTNHSNYLQVHSNTGDPQYGRFLGNYGRHLLVDFDFLF
jgi:hypothetical protein